MTYYIRNFNLNVKKFLYGRIVELEVNETLQEVWSL
jgi:hypothetical protein